MLPLLVALAVQSTGPGPELGIDPTETLTRVELLLGHSDVRRRAVRTSLLARVDYSWVERLALRADVPFEHVDPEGGLGDVRAQIGWRAFDERSFAMFFGCGVVLDTATESELGAGSDRAFVLAAGSAALPEIRSRLTETIEHFVSFDRDAGRDGVALTKLDLHLATEWSPTTWTRAGIELFVDWKAGEHTGMNLDVEIGKAAASGFAVWLRPAIGVFGRNVDGVVDWSLSAGARWLF